MRIGLCGFTVMMLAACRDPRPPSAPPPPPAPAIVRDATIARDAAIGARINLPNESIDGLTGGPTMSRDAAHAVVAQLPQVVALGSSRRIRNLPDATDLTSCTGSAGECMYWFAVAASGSTRQLFAVDPSTGQAFRGTVPDLVRARAGDYVAVGGGGGS